MTSLHAPWRILAAASLASVALIGCGGGGGGTVPTPPPISNAVSFSAFATQAFSNSANSTPVSVDNNFVFDVDEDPTSFDSLILSGAY